MRGCFQLGPQQTKDPLDIAEDFTVPDPDNTITERRQAGIALAIGRVVGMLSAIDFDDQTLISADEIDVVPSYGLLPRELVAPEPAVAQAKPKRPFRTGDLLSERAGTPCRYGVWSAHPAVMLSLEPDWKYKS